MELERRIDFELREGLVESRYWSAVTSHTGYWCSHDIALFLLTFIYKQKTPPSDPTEDTPDPDWVICYNTHTHTWMVSYPEGSHHLLEKAQINFISLFLTHTNCSNTLIIHFPCKLPVIQLFYHLGVIVDKQTSFQDVHSCLFLCHLYTIAHPTGDSVSLGTPKEVHPLPVWPQVTYNHGIWD